MKATEIHMRNMLKYSLWATLWLNNMPLNLDAQGGKQSFLWAGRGQRGMQNGRSLVFSPPTHWINCLQTHPNEMFNTNSYEKCFPFNDNKNEDHTVQIKAAGIPSKHFCCHIWEKQALFVLHRIFTICASCIWKQWFWLSLRFRVSKNQDWCGLCIKIITTNRWNNNLTTLTLIF